MQCTTYLRADDHRTNAAERQLRLQMYSKGERSVAERLMDDVEMQPRVTAERLQALRAELNRLSKTVQRSQA
jgi:hypothetical protein